MRQYVLIFVEENHELRIRIGEIDSDRKVRSNSNSNGQLLFSRPADKSLRAPRVLQICAEYIEEIVPFFVKVRNNRKVRYRTANDVSFRLLDTDSMI